jgi:glycerol-3-phosphate acyltransferase PlsY
MMAIVFDQTIWRLTGWELAGVLASYLLGCFTTGYYLVRWRTGQDVRMQGSGAAGATNVSRLLGRSGFVVTFLGDFAKGALALGLARQAGYRPMALVLVMLAVVAGHNWPVQLGFRGGKGIATSLGAMLMWDRRVALGIGGIFLVVFAGLRQFMLSGLLAYVGAPVIGLILKLGLVNIAGIIILSIEVLVAHHQNLREEIVRLKSTAKL